MPPHTPPSVVIWRLTDSKVGHEKQSLGLAQALLRLRDGQCSDLPVKSGGCQVWNWLSGRFPPGRDLPAPDLILGAGHGTHLAMLAARRAYGGKTVVLMKPSLPLAWFDLCLIPLHDQPPARANVLPTTGALNPLRASGAHDPKRGLILIGGPSSHFRWDADALHEQIKRLLDANPEIHWTLTTSRRTPSMFASTLPAGLDCRPFDQTPAGWLEQQLAVAGQVWVSPDSVSMVYEALTAGCRVGVFDLEPIKGSRVARGLAGLRDDGIVRSLADGHWQERPALDEAGRCARLILERWF